MVVANTGKFVFPKKLSFKKNQKMTITRLICNFLNSCQRNMTLKMTPSAHSNTLQFKSKIGNFIATPILVIFEKSHKMVKKFFST